MKISITVLTIGLLLFGFLYDVMERETTEIQNYNDDHMLDEFK